MLIIVKYCPQTMPTNIYIHKHHTRMWRSKRNPINFRMRSENLDRKVWSGENMWHLRVEAVNRID